MSDMMPGTWVCQKGSKSTGTARPIGARLTSEFKMASAEAIVIPWQPGIYTACKRPARISIRTMAVLTSSITAHSAKVRHRSGGAIGFSLPLDLPWRHDGQSPAVGHHPDGPSDV